MAVKAHKSTHEHGSKSYSSSNLYKGKKKKKNLVRETGRTLKNKRVLYVAPQLSPTTPSRPQKMIHLSRGQQQQQQERSFFFFYFFYLKKKCTCACVMQWDVQQQVPGSVFKRNSTRLLQHRLRTPSKLNLGNGNNNDNNKTQRLKKKIKMRDRH